MTEPSTPEQEAFLALPDDVLKAAAQVFVVGKNDAYRTGWTDGFKAGQATTSRLWMLLLLIIFGIAGGIAGIVMERTLT